MKYLSASPLKNSDKESADFFCLNNCGAIIEADKPVLTKREHGRTDYQLIYICQGSLEVTLSGETTVLGSGNVLFYRPHEPQIYRTGEDVTTFYWIHFSGSEVRRLVEFFDGNYCFVGDFEEFCEYCADAVRVCATESNINRLYYGGKLISLIALLWQKYAGKEENTGRQLIKEALLDMHMNFTVARTNEEYARMCGMSKSHFIRTFHKCIEMPPQKYRTLFAVREAKHLLKSNSVAATADILGFSDVFYFSRVFKKHTGLSPSEYKKS